MDKILRKSNARIIFDLDGTLIHSAPSLCSAGNQILKMLGRDSVSIEKYTEFIGRGIERQVESLLNFSGGLPKDDLKLYVSEFKRVYDNNPLVDTVCYPGVHQALISLKESGSELFLCTQKNRFPAEKILVGLNLISYFDGFTFGDSLEVMKPNPKTVHHALKKSGNGPLIYIGDSETDSETAYNSGAVFFLFSGGYRQNSVIDIRHDLVFHEHADIFRGVSNWIENEFK